MGNTSHMPPAPKAKDNRNLNSNNNSKTEKHETEPELRFDDRRSAYLMVSIFALLILLIVGLELLRPHS